MSLNIRVQERINDGEPRELHGRAKWARVFRTFLPILMLSFVAGYATCLAVTYLTVGAP